MLTRFNSGGVTGRMETTQAGGARRKLPMEAEKLEADSCAAYGMDVEMTVSDIMLKATKTIGRMEPGLKEIPNTRSNRSKETPTSLVNNCSA